MRRLSALAVVFTFLVGMLFVGHSLAATGGDLRPSPAGTRSDAPKILTEDTSLSGENGSIYSRLGSAPEIRGPARISIPYGISPTLPLVTGGQEVRVTGHGGCTDGEVVTVEITITQQSTGAMATGETQQDCNGELQHWFLTATAQSVYDFTTGDAEGCGLATTRDNGVVTDSYAWCVDLTLARVVYLPAIRTGS